MTIKVIIADDNSFVREGMKIILTTFPEFEVLAAVQDGKEAVDFCETHEVDVALLDIQMPHMNGVEATRQLAERTRTKSLILTTFDDEAFILDAIKYGAKGYLLKNNEPERIRDAIVTVYNGYNVFQDAALDKLKSGLMGGTGALGSNAATGARTGAPGSNAATGARTGAPGSKTATGAGAGASGSNAATGARTGAPRNSSGTGAAAGAPRNGGNRGGDNHRSTAADDSKIDRSLFTERELDVMSLIAKGLSNREISKQLFISEGTVANYITAVLGKTGLEHRTQIAIYYLTGRSGAGG